MSLIPPQIVAGSGLYIKLCEYASKPDIKHILEIGSSSGEGSTSALVSGNHYPFVYCIEPELDRFEKLVSLYKDSKNVKCYRAMAVPVSAMMTVREVKEFWEKYPHYCKSPLLEMLKWLDYSDKFIKTTPTTEDGIQWVKRDNNLTKFDLVFLDGCPFSGMAELKEVLGSRYIVLDDTLDIKCYDAYIYLKSSKDYKCVVDVTNDRNGYAIFQLLNAK